MAQKRPARPSTCIYTRMPAEGREETIEHAREAYIKAIDRPARARKQEEASETDRPAGMMDQERDYLISNIR